MLLIILDSLLNDLRTLFAVFLNPLLEQLGIGLGNLLL